MLYSAHCVCVLTFGRRLQCADFNYGLGTTQKLEFTHSLSPFHTKTTSLAHAQHPMFITATRPVNVNARVLMATVNALANKHTHTYGHTHTLQRTGVQN